MQKTLDRFFFLVMAVAVLATLAHIAFADMGKYAAMRTEVGNTVNTRQITLSTQNPTKIAAAADNRPDETCFNNSANTIWIGSNALTTSLLYTGFPVLSSTTFQLVSITTEVWALCNNGTCDVRCWDGLTQ